MALARDYEQMRRWPIEALRAELEGRNAPSDAVRRVTRTTIDQGVRGQWVRGPDARPRERGVVLYVHGGSYLFGSTHTHADTIARVALASGCEVLAIDYRLAPEHRYPAQLEDALAAIQWLESQGVARSRVVIAGESAGGNLVLAALLALRDRAPGKGSVCAGIMVSPWLDLRAQEQSFERNAAFDFGSRAMLLEHARLVAGDRALDDPALSVGLASARGIAPVLVQAGTVEILFDQCQSWVERARSEGVEVQWEPIERLPHAPFFFAAQHPNAQRALDSIGAYIRGALDR